MIYNIKNKIRSMSHKRKVIKQVYLQANKIKIKVSYKISDKNFAKIKYKENTGKSLNLESPNTFNEKLWWLKLNNRDPLLTLCSDKVSVREYVKECGLENILNTFYGVYDDATKINFDNLPEKAFIKTSHGSGTNIIWDKSIDFDKEKFIKQFNYSLNQNYYWQSREWNYKNIKPRIIVEKVFENKENRPLIDYRFLCFDGVVKLIFVDIETAAKDGSHSPYAKRNIYDKKFNYLDIKVSRDSFDKSMIIKPKNFDEMIKCAEKLASPFPFCRVDLYNIDGKIYFGEITFYPGGANQIVEPEEWEVKLGQWIDLDNKKIIIKDCI